jgi:hypothetical protein
MAAGIHALQAIHQVVEGFDIALAGRELRQPLPERLIERGMALAGHEAGAIDQFFFGTQGHIAHTRTVYTRTV